jgi:hypothetical protein
MQATARRLSVVSANSTPRRRLIRDVSRIHEDPCHFNDLGLAISRIPTPLRRLRRLAHDWKAGREEGARRAFPHRHH